MIKQNPSYDEQSRQQGEQVSQCEQSSQWITTRHAGRKQLCIVCQSALYKYTCPACKSKTCGISCLNKHKSLKQCSGVFNPAARVQKEQIGQKQVQKDYLFLKEMLSSADKVKKALSGVNAVSQQPKRFKIIRAHAKKNYNITIHSAPSIMQRHRENISFYFVKSKEFYWVIEFLYFQTDSKSTRYLTDPVPDSTVVKEILSQQFLCKQLLEKGINTQKKEEFLLFIESKIIKNSQVNILAQPVKKQIPLRQCLVNQTLYEYPTFIVVHTSLKQNYLKTRELIENKSEKSTFNV